MPKEFRMPTARPKTSLSQDAPSIDLALLDPTHRSRARSTEPHQEPPPRTKRLSSRLPSPVKSRGSPSLRDANRSPFSQTVRSGGSISLLSSPVPSHRVKNMQPKM